MALKALGQRYNTATTGFERGAFAGSWGCPMVRAACVAVLLLSVSGCVGSESTSGPLAGLSEAPSFDDTTGAIHILVTDDELAPIANATVGVVTATGERDAALVPVMTSLSGEAVLSNLPPATYHVQAVALGYESSNKAVDVRAGEVAEIQLALIRLPSDDPYYETITKTDYVRSIVWRIGPNCDTVVQPPVGTCLGFQAHDVTFYRVLLQDWETLVDEAQWVPNSAFFHQRAYLFATFPNVTDFSGVPDFKSPGHFEAGGTSPVVLRIERATIRERGFPEESQYGPGPNDRGTRFRAVNNFDDVGVPGVIGVSLMLDQTMHVYNTEFHKMVAPPEFSALPDA